MTARISTDIAMITTQLPVPLLINENNKSPSITIKLNQTTLKEENTNIHACSPAYVYEIKAGKGINQDLLWAAN